METLETCGDGRYVIWFRSDTLLATFLQNILCLSLPLSPSFLIVLIFISISFTESKKCNSADWKLLVEMKRSLRLLQNRRSNLLFATVDETTHGCCLYSLPMDYWLWIDSNTLTFCFNQERKIKSNCCRRPQVGSAFRSVECECFCLSTFRIRLHYTTLHISRNRGIWCCTWWWHPIFFFFYLLNLPYLELLLFFCYNNFTVFSGRWFVFNTLHASLVL